MVDGVAKFPPDQMTPNNILSPERKQPHTALRVGGDPS